MPTAFEVADERVRTVLANVEILGRSQILKLENLLRTLGQKYKCPVVAERYAEATTDNCARAAASNLELLVKDLNLIKGFSQTDSRIFSANLEQLIAKLHSFERKQPAEVWGARLDDAVLTFKGSDLMQPDFAGSATRS